MRFAYPMMLDVTDRLAVIVGGGTVAARKAAALLAAGATRVRVIATVMHPSLQAGVERRVKAYEASDLDGAGLVFAATDSAVVNEQVVRDAHERGLLVNRADEGRADDGESVREAGGDFVTPAKLVAGEIVVTVSAQSAALSAAVRDDLRRKLDERFVKMAEAMITLRPSIRDGGIDPERRKEIFRDLASADALDVLSGGGTGGGMPGLRKWLIARYPELKEPLSK